MRKQIISVVAAAALLSVTSAKAELIYALTTLNEILSFDSADPGNILSFHAVTGLQTSESLVGIDARPANGLIYGIGNGSRIYTVNPLTGAATQVGSGQLSPLLNGSTFGFDFNPQADRMRITTDLDQNLRVNPDTGVVVATDGTLTYATGDAFFGSNPSINGLAYSNNVSGASSTVLYALDSLQNSLVTIGSPNPNDGTIHTVGLLGFDASRVNGFDISGITGIAYIATPATSSDPGANLYSVNLENGIATLIGKIGNSEENILLQGLTVDIPEPGIGALLAFGGGIGCLMLWKRRRTT